MAAFVLLLVGVSEASVDVDSIYADPESGWIGSDREDGFAYYDIDINVTCDGGSTNVTAELSVPFDGWDHDFDHNTEFWEDVNETMTLHTVVRIIMPDNATAGEWMRTTLYVNSTNGTGRSVLLNTTVAKYGVDLTVPDTDAEVAPEEDEETAMLVADIVYTGSVAGDIEVNIRTVSIEELTGDQKIGKLTWVELGWSGEGGEIQNGTTIVIEDMEPGAANNETIYIFFDVGDRPVKAEAGEYVYNLTAEAMDGARDDPDALKHMHIYLTIDEVPGFEVRFTQTDVTIDPTGELADDTVTVDIIITNIGNFEDTYTVRTSSAHSDIEIRYDGSSRKDIKIMPDEEQTVQMEITVANDTRMGTYDVIFLVQSEKGLSETETITVVVKAPDIQISKYDISLNKTLGAINTGDDVSVFVRVWNNGTGPAKNVEVKFLVGDRVKVTVTINITEAQYKDVSFDWNDIGTGKQTIRVQTSGALPDEISVAKSYDFTIPPPDEEDKGGTMETALAVTAVSILALVVIGLLLVQHRKK